MALESVSAASLHGPPKQISRGAQKVHAQGCNTNGQLLCTQQSLFVRITFCVLFKVVDFVTKRSFDLSMLRIPMNCSAGFGQYRLHIKR